MSLSSWTPDSLRRAIQAAGVSLWSWHVADDRFDMDEQGFVMWAVEPTDALRFEDLSARIHPADRDRVRAAFAATRGIEGSYETDFRIMIGDEIRWISARGLGSDIGMHQGFMYGIFLDVTGRKQAEEGHELLAGEMSHRVKNLLAIASGLTQIASRSCTTAADMAKDLTSRLTALGRAHDLVRPLPGHQGKAALLGDLLVILLSPYEDLGAFSGRIRVAVPRMGVGEGAATTLALVLHELATNSVKYGALSSDTGTLDLSGALEGDKLKIVWLERGGPRVDRPTNGGYGGQLVTRSVNGHLGGSIDYAWEPDGLVVTLMVTASKLAN
ncbi:sensor histidine kinase [Phreatobacter oligotrophus]|uniref:histidine kinase n=1 Tax=Phreatobacter oligotrophus TaxID=1122261 RepID=A0A2T4YX91_9HYPH|nr:sensor histidine kinase [Phreatobacter oligotrophus]PTM50450.1 two-component sensor histidine kinase [Phreatobacter oligotrophus]